MARWIIIAVTLPLAGCFNGLLLTPTYVNCPVEETTICAASRWLCSNKIALIDVDGVRHYSWRGEGIRRLLRSMRDHPQYTPADSLALCRGYAPWAKVVQNEIEPQMNTDEHR